MKVLILDDDEGLLEAVRRILELHGIEVDTASRARDAVAMVAATPYDFVLVDYKMPENDGLWFMENASIPRTTKVLLITAYVNRTVINRMFELGASGYIIKPFGEDELLRNLDFHAP